MKTAILIHGMPSKEGYLNPEADSQSNCHWFPWLQQQLIVNGILTNALEMPKPYEPVYEDWKREFERFDLNGETMLVGHSCGGGFIVRYLSENKDVKVGKVVLVAPWTDEEKSLNTGMFDFEVDPGFVDRTAGTTIFHSTDDDKAMHDTVNMLRDKVPNIGYKEFGNYGHFVFKDMNTREFPELLQALLD